MPSWKKVITSGSDAAFKSVIATTGFTGSLQGTASYVTGSIFTNTNLALSASYALTASNAINANNANYANSAGSAGSANYVASANVDGPLGSDSVTNASIAVTAYTASSVLTDTGVGSIYEDVERNLNISSTNKLFISGNGVEFTTTPTLPNVTYDITASYATNALTATSAASATNATNAQTASIASSVSASTGPSSGITHSVLLQPLTGNGVVKYPATSNSMTYVDRTLRVENISVVTSSTAVTMSATVMEVSAPSSNAGAFIRGIDSGGTTTIALGRNSSITTPENGSMTINANQSAFISSSGNVRLQGKNGTHEINLSEGGFDINPLSIRGTAILISGSNNVEFQAPYIAIPTGTSNPSSPKTGSLYYNRSTNFLFIYNGTAWRSASFS